MAIHVLHLDDEPDFADPVAEVVELEHDALNGYPARTSDDGLELRHDREIDCIVPDYDLPTTNANALPETVRSDPRGSRASSTPGTVDPRLVPRDRHHRQR
ncbi:MAG: hypothetical protein ABEH59_02545 [Halobacteriales archaeon]